MARPIKRTVDYFPHVCDTDDGKTIPVLQNKYGNDGYAFWFRLLEFLGKRNNLFFDYNNPADLEFLCAKTHQNDTETVLRILNDLAVLGAIDPELHQKKIIWSQNFVDGVADAFSRSVAGVPQRPTPKIDNVSKTGQSVLKTGQSVDRNTENSTVMPQIKLKKIKLNNIKENIKEKELPGFIDKETWNSFLEMRSKMKAPPTDRAKGLLIKELEKLKAAGHDPNLVLEQSTMNNWRGVFPVKEKNGGYDATSKRLTTRDLPTKYTTPEEWRRQRQQMGSPVPG